MKRILQNSLKIVLPLLLGVALFYALYSKLDTAQIVDSLRSGVNYNWVLFSVVITIFSHLFRAQRWRLQLRTLGVSPTLRSVANAIFGTYALNLLFPRLGEVWRCSYVAKREGLSFSQVLGSVVSDRLSDTVAVLLVTLMAFLLQMRVFKAFLARFPQIEQGLESLLTTPWLYLVGLSFVLALIWLFKKRGENRFVVKVKRVMRNLWAGFATVGRMPHKYRFILLTVAIWMCYFLQLYICFFAFPFTQHLTLLVALVLFAMGSISMGIPVQGGLGAWHIAIIAALGLYGVNENQAGAFALVVHGAQMVIMVLLGIYAFFSMMLDKGGKDDKIG